MTKGTKVTYESDVRSYTLPASAIGVLVPCSVFLGSSAVERTIKAPSGGEYIVSGANNSAVARVGNFTSLYSGGAEIVSGYMVCVKGFYIRIS